MTFKTWQPSAAEMRVVKEFRNRRLGGQASLFRKTRLANVPFGIRPFYVDSYPSPFADDTVTRAAVQAEHPNVPGPVMPTIVDSALQRAVGIAEMQDDWDGEGSRGYTSDTINRADGVVRGIARRLSRPALDRLSMVELTPGPDGSIDIEVVVGDKRLLINAARDSDSPILFYGHATNRSFPIEGELSPTSSLRFLSEWLVA